MKQLFANTDITINQQTLRDAVVFDGRGLHSGLKVIMTVMPADPYTGIVFVRRDITGVNNEVLARWDRVTDTELSTTVSNHMGVRVSTIEHLMAAIYAAGIDNARIVIDAPEVPILDGSAHLFLQAFDQVGVVVQNAERQVMVIDRPISITEDHASASYSPALVPWLDMSIDFKNDLIGHQSLSLANDGDSFRQVAKARTFGFKHHLVQLKRRGFARGSSLNNAILIDDNGVVNKEGLRYSDEFVRHKYLDAVGDLALAGHLIMGHFNGVKSGHRLNNMLLRKVFASRNWHLSPISEVHNQWQSFSCDAALHSGVRA